VGLSEIGDLPGPLLGLEPLVAGADGGFVKPWPSLSERTYSVISSRSSMNFASELDEADELLAADCELLRVLPEYLAISFMM